MMLNLVRIFVFYSHLLIVFIQRFLNKVYHFCYFRGNGDQHLSILPLCFINNDNNKNGSSQSSDIICWRIIFGPESSQVVPISF